MRPKKKSERWGRSEVARALGVTLTRVRALEASGKLRATVDASGWHSFDPREVGAYARTRKRRRAVDGELAAKVFRMISDGYPLREIVIETAQTPDTIRKLHDEWRKPFVPVADGLLEHFDKSAAELDARIARQQGRGPSEENK